VTLLVELVPNPTSSIGTKSVAVKFPHFPNFGRTLAKLADAARTISGQSSPLLEAIRVNRWATIRSDNPHRRNFMPRLLSSGG